MSRPNMSRPNMSFQDAKRLPALLQPSSHDLKMLQKLLGDYFEAPILQLLQPFFSAEAAVLINKLLECLVEGITSLRLSPSVELKPQQRKKRVRRRKKESSGSCSRQCCLL
jgi:hypothetical protein